MKKSLFLIIAVFGCVPIPQSTDNQSDTGKFLQLIDASYEPQIKTVRLYSPGADSRSEIMPSVIRMGNWTLQLEFDDLRDQRDTYNVRIIHCNQDWTKSTLADLDYMPQYNEFPINTFDFSLDTHTPYVHYRLKLPAVKLPGNYVALVYRGSDRSDIILTKRFMVYDQRISFLRDGSLVGPGAAANANQQLNFTINYKNIDIPNPMENVNVSIRQNQRWDNLVAGIKPSFIRESARELEYRFFDPEKMMKGGNEFRFFDLRSLNYPGRNVGSVDKSQKPFRVFIQTDKSRNGQAYAIYDDLNGNFNNDNYDFRNAVSGNYAIVQFALQSPEPINGKVYLNGAFTNWSFKPEYEMIYDAIKKEYRGTAFLKQGWYDYQYIVKSSTLPPYYLEGTHFETENEYEIFIYYRPFQPQADLLVGYIKLEQNPR
jgi:hypothetical protein